MIESPIVEYAELILDECETVKIINRAIGPAYDPDAYDAFVDSLGALRLAELGEKTGHDASDIVKAVHSLANEYNDIGGEG